MALSSRGSDFVASMMGIPRAPPGGVNVMDYRPNSLNQPFRFRQLLKDISKSKKAILGTCVSMPSLEVARVSATLNYDFIFLDAEHTPFAPNVLQDMIKTLNYNSEGATLTVVRLPTHGPDWTSWALDAGASAVVFPHTETAEQAKAVVANCRFAPLGHRSFPPFATVPGHTDGTPRDGMTILDVYNENAAVVMQIESAEGVKNAEAICAVDGVDAIMIGTGDLRMSLGLMPGVDGPEPIFQEALATIEAAARKNNLPILGFALGGPMVNNRLNRGWQLLMMSADTLALVVGQAGPLKETRGVVEAFEKGIAGKN